MDNKNGISFVRGFTLLEVAIVVMIGGILMSSLSAGLIVYMKRQKMDVTSQRMADIQESIQQYLNVNKKLPCPASLSAEVDTAEFGIEVDLNCSSGAHTGTFSASGVRIGAVPVRSLNLPDQYIADGWHSRYTYAVTEALATGGTFSQSGGRISLVDSNDNTVITPANSAHYVLISHGENKNGAYTFNGISNGTCTTGMLESINCTRPGDRFRKTILISEGANADYFDDIVSFQNATADEFTMPPGAIVPFELSACPDGWQEVTNMAGRVVMGAGNYSEAYVAGTRNWAYSNNYSLNQTGGYATFPLNVDELPSHNHELPMGGNAFEQINSGASPVRSVNDLSTANTGKQTFGTGGNQPHENRQPYRVFLYCKKN